jgi:pyrimidine operon attenuation protein/uracil phosphoribosyltransferase
MAARAMMDSDKIRGAITRLGHEIVERKGGRDGLVLIGSQRRGSYWHIGSRMPSPPRRSSACPSRRLTSH